MAMSFAQDGSGFPYFASCVFKYFRGDEINNISVPPSEVPNEQVRAVLEEVCILCSLYVTIHLCVCVRVRACVHLGSSL